MSNTNPDAPVRIEVAMPRSLYDRLTDHDEAPRSRYDAATGRAEYVAEPGISHEWRAAGVTGLFAQIALALEQAGRSVELLPAGATRVRDGQLVLQDAPAGGFGDAGRARSVSRPRLGHRRDAVGAQHPVHLGEQLALVRDVMKGVVHHDAVARTVVEGQPASVVGRKRGSSDQFVHESRSNNCRPRASAVGETSTAIVRQP